MDNITAPKDYTSYLDKDKQDIINKNKENSKTSNILNENELKNFKEVIFKDLGKLHKNLEFLYNEDRTKENYDNLILINNIIIQ